MVEPLDLGVVESRRDVDMLDRHQYPSLPTQLPKCLEPTLDSHSPAAPGQGKRLTWQPYKGPQRAQSALQGPAGS